MTKIEASSYAEGPTWVDAKPPFDTQPGVDLQSGADAQPVTPQDEFLVPRSTGVRVEIVMDSYRVNGEIHAPGIPRRLVDILNSSDLAYFTMHSGTLDDPFDGDGERQDFDLIQLDRAGILFAVPCGEVHKPDPFEVVRKKRVLSTLVVPGYKITGDLHLMPDADPTLVTIISDHHFVPLTDATVLADKGRAQAWQEPLLIINMTRALFFGTKKAAF